MPEGNYSDISDDEKGEYHYFRNHILHEKKLAEYKKFLKKENVFLNENILNAA